MLSLNYPAKMPTSMDSLKELFQGSTLERIPTYLMNVDYTGGNRVFTQLRELSKFH